MKFSMSLSKAEKIMAFLNQLDPEGTYKASQDYRVYSYEADTIAQGIKSKPENGPVPLRQQKRMMNLEDSMRSQLPNEFTNMFKKMNGWDVDNT